jgi:DNA-binding FrmR family transcriptional regulator
MNATRAARTKLVNRMRSGQGHMIVIAQMIERAAPCDKVLLQTRAVRSSPQAHR